MAHVDGLTAQTAAQTLGTDVFYVGREGDADPDRQMTVSEMRTAIVAGGYGADNTTGTVIGIGETYVIPAGVWYAFSDSWADLYLHAYINAAWRNLNPAADQVPAPLWSDGVNLRLHNDSPAPMTVYLRRAHV